MAENEIQTAQEAAAEENHIIAERRAKLAHLRETGVAIPTTSCAPTFSATCARSTAK